MRIKIKRPDSRASQRTEPAYNEEPWILEEWEPYYKEQGIKIRDFAHEPPTEGRAPATFDPCNAMLKFVQNVKLDLWEVWHLCDMGWLTEEQAKTCSNPADWPSLMDASVRRPEYPWTPLKLEKPTGTDEEVLAALRRHRNSTYVNRTEGEPQTENADEPDPVAADPESEEDSSDSSVTSEDVATRLYAPVAIKRLHDLDSPAGEEQHRDGASQLRHKRQKALSGEALPRPPSPQKVNLERNSLSTNSYPSPFQTPSRPTLPTTATVTESQPNAISDWRFTGVSPTPTPIPSDPSRNTTLPKPRGLTRTQTLLNF